MMRIASFILFSMTMLLPSTGHALDCAPLRPDAPIEESQELAAKAEIGGLLKRLFTAGGELRLTEAYEKLSARAADPDALMRWQSQFYLICQVLDEDSSLSSDEKIQIIKGLEAAERQAQIEKISGGDFEVSQSTAGTAVTFRTCVTISSGALGCDVTFLTEDTAKQLTLFGNSSSARSRLIDNQGNTYLASRVELGGDDSSRSVKTELPPGVMMRGRVFFDNISRSATEASLLEIKGRVDRQDISTYAFEKVGFD